MRQEMREPGSAIPGLAVQESRFPVAHDTTPRRWGIGMTRLQFEATLGGVKVTTPKAAYTYGEPAAGELHLTLTVRQPAPPRQPVKPYELERQPPSLPKRKRGESDEDYEERTARPREELAHRAETEKRYAADMERWRQAVLGARDRTMAYAQLVGVAAVFGSKPVTVTIEPADQDLLPGFEASLLAPPEPLTSGDRLPDAVRAAAVVDEFDEELAHDELVDGEDEP